MFIVLTHPSWTKSDIDWITKDLKRRDPPFAGNIKVMLKEDFLQILKVQDNIRSKIDQLYDLVADCLQKRYPKLREESLIKLKDIYDQSKAISKFPLSQLKLVRSKGSFFDID